MPGHPARPWSLVEYSQSAHRKQIWGKFRAVSGCLAFPAVHDAQLVEISPAFAEWFGLKRTRKFLASLTLGAVIIGITLSTLHQSGLWALFLMAKWKIHPLWYTEFIPLLFFVSSIYAGLSVVIFIGTVSFRVFDMDRIDEEYRKSWDDII